MLSLIAAYEHGFAEALKTKSLQTGRKLSYWEASRIFEELEKQPVLEPLIIQARNKMASRDMAFRDAFHAKLEEYIRPVSAAEIEHFFGRGSDEVERVMAEHREQISQLAECDVLFEQLLAENEDVLRRLKERE